MPDTSHTRFLNGLSAHCIIQEGTSVAKTVRVTNPNMLVCWLEGRRDLLDLLWDESEDDEAHKSVTQTEASEARNGQ